MKRLAFTLAFLVILSPACTRDDRPSARATQEPASPMEVEPGAVERAVLDRDDLGEGWVEEKSPAPSTLQVGGKVGPANIEDSEQEATTAFEEQGDSGYVTNSLFLLESAANAEAVLLAHVQATDKKWTQDRMDGGKATFRRTGRVSKVPELGDETYTAKISTTIRDGSGSETKRKIEYVVYRVDRLVAFVIGQDTSVGKYVRLLEKKVERLGS